MKNARKLMALILGVIMAMGCLSVSAANNDLTVTENPAKIIFADDFSDNTLNTEHIVPGEATVQSDGVLGANPAPDGAFATIYAAKEGVSEIVTFEYDLTWSNLANYSTAQFQMLFKNESNATVADIRLYGGAYKFGIISSDNKTIPWKYVDYTGINKAHVKVRFNPATKGYALWLDGVEALSEADGVKYARNSFTAMTAVTMAMANCDKGSVSIDNFKIYTEDSKNAPAVWEDVYKNGFEKTVDTFSATSNELIPEINSNVSYAQVNGALTMKTTAAGAGTKVYLQPNKEALTGKYVVEMILKNCSQTTTNGGYHRIAPGNFASYYLQWLPTKALKFRLLGSTYADSTSNMEDFNANGDTLKVTMCFDTETYEMKVYYNDIFAFEHSFAGDTTNRVACTSFEYINFNLYSGEIELADLRVYRPLEIDENTGIKIEEKGNKVKFAVNNEKTGNIYFAKYDVEDEAKSLASIATSGINFVPGKIYTVDKTDWNGAKAFLWDENLAPIVNPWNLSQAE